MSNLIANSEIVFRQEFDDWALLFEPDTGRTYGLDPVSAFIWLRLDGNNSKEEILSALDKECEEGIPKNASLHFDEFVTDLLKYELIRRN